MSLQNIVPGYQKPRLLRVIELGSLVVILSSFVVATTVACLCHYDKATSSAVRSFIAAVNILPTRKWSQYSSFQDASSAYYFFIFPAFFASISWVVAHYSFPFPLRLRGETSFADKLLHLFRIVVLGFIGVLILLSDKSGGQGLVRLGSSFSNFLIFGGLTIVAPGLLFGACIVFGLKIFSKE